ARLPLHGVLACTLLLAGAQPASTGVHDPIQCCRTGGSGAPKCRVKSRRASQKNGGMEAGPGTCNPDPCGGATATSSTSTTTTSTSTTSTTSTTVPPCGTFLLKWGGPVDGELYYPLAVATDGSGNVYVADSRFSRIQKFDANGTFLTAWGSPGSGNGQFGGGSPNGAYAYDPSGVATDGSGNVYVADAGNHRIQKFDANGTFLTAWGSPGSGNGQFGGGSPNGAYAYDPSGVATDGSGNVYVADAGNHRIQKFDANGTFLTAWGSPGSGDGQFRGPEGVATDASGHVYVTDYYGGRIQKFDANGTFLTAWGGFSYLTGVAADASGNVYVADAVNLRVQKFDASGAFLAAWGSERAPGEFGTPPSAVATFGSGNVYVADGGNGFHHAAVPSRRIEKFDASGTFLTAWGTDGQPLGVATDGSGNV